MSLLELFCGVDDFCPVYDCCRLQTKKPSTRTRNVHAIQLA
jgi:hypothetical protein